ncbi:MFS transporter [Cupriavidus pinatubonensis]|uniref:Fosfomycin resistance protein AbaF n=1 Tax=Cupriavidus pinatubonensis TaxID=248026 RepID=A0ABN7ZDL1_9BURK|nr:MFS transporter [Cupriavidus pinatubonensis]CAG9183378.1 Fosfomycin resistance protein AbaF [Cupriavidus pinatubonensis]
MNHTSVAVGTPPTVEDRTTVGAVSKVAFASMVGTTIEFYDYFIYGAAAALVFPKLFFSNMDPVLATVVSFATLGVAFVTRPIGAVIFGHFGDTIGRKAMLLASLLLMGLATVAIGLLPTYEQIGIAAPLLLVALRLIQGLAVGGEWGGATTMIVEYAPPHRRGFYGTFVQLGNAFGVLLSTGAFALVAMLPEDLFFAWGWRVPFVASLLLLSIGVFIRMRIEEPPAFKRMKEQRKEHSLPLGVVLKKYPKQVFIAAGLRVSETVIGYIAITYVLQYTTTHLGMSREHSLTGLMFAAALAVLTFPLWGMLSDRIGRRAVFLIGALSACAFAFPLFWLLDTRNIIALYLVIAVCYSGLVGAMYGLEPAYLSELFPTDIRYTGVSLGSQLTGIIGGMTPAIATLLLAWADGRTWPISLFIIICSIVTIWCTFLAGETKHRDLNQMDGWH